MREMGISHRTIWMAVLAFVCLLGALAFYTAGYYAKVVHEKELRQLRSEKTELLECIETMGRSAQSLGKQIGVLIGHGKALRVLANLPEIDEDTRKVGVGGPLYEEENAVLPLFSDAEFLVSRVQGDLDQLLRETELERVSLTEIEERLTRDQNLRRIFFVGLRDAPRPVHRTSSDAQRFGHQRTYGHCDPCYRRRSR